MANTYNCGDVVTVTATFRDGSGALVDPTSVLFAYTDPSGNVTTLTYGIDAELNRSSTGVYYAQIATDEAGTWSYTWTSTGDGAGSESDYFTVLGAISGVMLKTLRREMGYELGECVTGTADSGCTTTTLVDAELIDSDESESQHEGAWLYIASGALAGQTRRISDYAVTTGTLTVSRAWASAPVSGVEYEIHHKLSPTNLNRCINWVLEQCYFLDEILLTPVSGQRQYSLAAYPYITRPEQIVDALWRVGTTTDKYRYAPLEWYQVRNDAGELTLDINPYSFTAGEYMVLRVVRPYSQLSADTDTTDCPKELLLAGAKTRAYELLLQKGTGQDVERYRRLRDEAMTVYTKRWFFYQPRPARRIQHGDSVKRGISSDVVQ